MGKSKVGRRTRKLVFVLLLLTLMAGVGGAAVFFIRRGMRKEGLHEKAAAALAAGRLEEAERLLRSILDANPDNEVVRARLVHLLTQDRRLAEATTLAKEWSVRHPESSVAWTARLDIAMRSGQLGEVERLARRAIDIAPIPCQVALIQARVLIGSAQALSEAQRISGQLAAGSDDLRVKAVFCLRAAEILEDLATMVAEPAKSGAVRRMRRFLDEAGTAVRNARQKEPHPRLDIVQARIQARSELEEERVAGLKTLQDWLGNHPEDATVRSALVAAATRSDEWSRALELMEGFEIPADYLQYWLPAARRLCISAPQEVVLPMLDASPRRDDVFVTRLRALVLLRSESEQDRTRGVELLSDLVRRSGLDPAIALASAEVLRRTGQGGPGIAMLEEAQQENPDIRVEAFLAGAALGSGPGDPAALDRIVDIAGRSSEPAENAAILRILGRAGYDASRAFLDAKVEAGGEQEATWRVLRAVVTVRSAARVEGDARAERLREANADLRAVPALAPDKSVLALALDVAVRAGDPKLAGLLGAHVVSAAGPPYRTAAQILAAGWRAAEASRLDQFREGLVEAAQTLPTKKYLELLARWMKQAPEPDGGTEKLLDELEGVEEEPASRVSVLVLETRLALAGGLVERAEAAARRLASAEPDWQGAREALAHVLGVQGRHEDVLALHEAEPFASPMTVAQRVVALRALEREDEALEAAREGVRQFPRDERLCILLARIHAGKDRLTEALAVLALAPETRRVVHLQAALLMEKGDDGMAEMHFWSLVGSNPADIAAWTGLRATLEKDGRLVEFDRELSKVIDSDTYRPPPRVRAELLLTRGMARQSSGRGLEALRDYEEGLRHDGRNWILLNNAAWLIQKHQSNRIEDARKYVRLALESRPDDPHLLDTSAMIEFAAGNNSLALEQLDKSISLRRDRAPEQLVRRARILLAMDREDEAREALRRVMTEFPETSAVTQARALLKDLDIKDREENEK